MATAPLLQQKSSTYHYHHSSTPASSSTMKKSHLSLARVILVICISFVLMTLAHIHYTNLHRQARGETVTQHDESNASNYNDPLPSDNPQTKQPEHELPPHEPYPSVVPETKPETKTSAPPPMEPELTVRETKLAITTRYINGTMTKTFKPKFYKDTKAARREMGSFLDTLAKRAWWTQNSGSIEGEAIEHGTPPTDVFFAYLPMGGGNNQFTSLQKAALLAKDLKRTLLIPPISPNSHIKTWSGPRYSEFYDLESFSAKSGIPVLEWHDIKQTPENPPRALRAHWDEFSEDFPCIPNGAIGVRNKNLFDYFRKQFLLNFTAATPESGVIDSTMGRSVEYSYARDVLLKDAKKDEPEMWKCLSCPYFLGGADMVHRAWKEIGLHLRFNTKIEAMADNILDMILPAVKTVEGQEPARRHPEFIIVHLRRGDIVTKCKPGQKETECLVQIEEIAKRVDDIEKERRITALESMTDKNAEVVLERLPVLVTTNEKRAEELEKLEKLGWIMLDHGDPELDAGGNEIPSKNKKLGTMTSLGPFYPPMLDAVLLTRGNYLIGMANSRMSQLATQRGSAWHGHMTMLM